MNVLLTGAAGHLGSHVRAALTAAGHTVTATDIKPAPPGAAPIVPCDLLDRAAVRALAASHDAVVHLAAHPKPDGHPDPLRKYLENVTMTAHVIDAAMNARARKFVFASSIHAFVGALENVGHLAPPPLTLPLDGDSPARPRYLYGLSKQVGEAMLRHAADTHGIEAVALRLPMCVESFEAARRWMKFEPARPVHDGFLAILTYREAARVVSAVLRATLPGYRCYLPSLPGNPLDIPLAELQQQFPHLPPRDPATPLTAFVDTSRLTRDTGWTPQS